MSSQILFLSKFGFETVNILECHTLMLKSFKILPVKKWSASESPVTDPNLDLLYLDKNEKKVGTGIIYIPNFCSDSDTDTTI